MAVFRPQSRDLGTVMREVDEDLAIFLGMRNAEKESRYNLSLVESNNFNGTKGLQLKPSASSPLNDAQEHTIPIPADDNGYNWQPDYSTLDQLEINVQRYTVNGSKTMNMGEATLVKVENSSKTSHPPADIPPRQDPSPMNTNLSALPIKRLSPSSEPRKSSPGPLGPTARPTLPAKPRPSRPSAPNSRATLPPSSKPRSRSSTALRPSSRSSTPNPSGARASTPKRGKPGSTTTTFKAPPKAVGHARPVSACRGSVNRRDEKLTRRQKSCSPPRIRAQAAASGRQRGTTASSARARAADPDGEDVNPVLMGAKMVDRVVNMRKLAPPKQEKCVSRDSGSRKPALENSGFGRSLSKKSLDMAIRHMVCHSIAKGGLV